MIARRPYRNMALRCGVGVMLAFALATSPAAAEEGGYQCSLPKHEGPSGAIFRVVSNEEKPTTYGTAFMITKTATTAYFLSARHVLVGIDQGDDVLLEDRLLVSQQGEMLRPTKFRGLFGHSYRGDDQKLRAAYDWILVAADVSAAPSIRNVTPLRLVYDYDKANLIPSGAQLMGYKPIDCAEEASKNEKICAESLSHMARVEPRLSALSDVNTPSFNLPYLFAIHADVEKEGWSGSPVQDQNYNVAGIMSEKTFKEGEQSPEEEEAFNTLMRVGLDLDKAKKMNGGNEFRVKKLELDLNNARANYNKAVSRSSNLEKQIAFTLMKVPMLAIKAHIEQAVKNANTTGVSLEAALNQGLSAELFSASALNFADQIMRTKTTKLSGSDLNNWSTTGLSWLDISLLGAVTGVRSDLPWTTGDDDTAKQRWIDKLSRASDSQCLGAFGAPSFGLASAGDSVRMASAASSVDKSGGGEDRLADAGFAVAEWMTLARRGEPTPGARLALAFGIQREFEDAIDAYTAADHRDVAVLDAAYARYADALGPMYENAPTAREARAIRTNIDRMLSGFDAAPRAGREAPQSVERLRALIEQP